MNRWFRYYDEALDDPKVQTLPPPFFKAWINLLCLASRCGGTLPSLNDIAFALRLESEGSASTLLLTLSERGLLDRDGETFHPHNWNARQFKSDGSTERVKQHRQRSKQQVGNVPRNVTTAVTETSPDTEYRKKERSSKEGVERKVAEPIKVSPDDPILNGSLPEWRNLYSQPDLDALQEEFELIEVAAEIDRLYHWCERKGIQKPNEIMALIYKKLKEKNGQRALAAAAKVGGLDAAKPSVSVLNSPLMKRMAAEKSKAQMIAELEHPEFLLRKQAQGAAA